MEEKTKLEHRDQIFDSVLGLRVLLNFRSSPWRGPGPALRGSRRKGLVGQQPQGSHSSTSPAAHGHREGPGTPQPRNSEHKWLQIPQKVRPCPPEGLPSLPSTGRVSRAWKAPVGARGSTGAAPLSPELSLLLLPQLGPARVTLPEVAAGTGSWLP